MFGFFLLAENGDTDPDTLKANSQGFIGCLSSVQFNHVAPLKAAVYYPSSAQVIVKGHFMESNCGTLTGADTTSSETTHSFAGTKHKTFINFVLWKRILDNLSESQSFFLFARGAYMVGFSTNPHFLSIHILYAYGYVFFIYTMWLPSQSFITCS